MKRKRNLVKNSSSVRRQRDPLPWKYCALSAVCGMFLLAGFFFAANLHFNSVGTAMENHELRLRITRLKNAQRRLKVAKMEVSSPKYIAERAKKIGFTTNGQSAQKPVVATTLISSVAENKKEVKPIKVVSLSSAKSQEKVKTKKAKTSKKPSGYKTTRTNKIDTGSSIATVISDKSFESRR